MPKKKMRMSLVTKEQSRNEKWKKRWRQLRLKEGGSGGER